MPMLGLGRSVCIKFTISIGLLFFGSFYNPVTLAATNLPTVDEIEKRAQSSIPEGELPLYREFENNDQDINALNQIIANATEALDYPSEIDSLSSKGISAINNIKTSNCQTDEAKISEAMQQLAEDIINVVSFVSQMKWGSEFNVNLAVTDVINKRQQPCKNIKDSINSTETVINDYFNKLKQKAISNAVSQKELLNKAKSVLLEVQERRSKLAEKLRTPAQQISNQLPWIMAVIGGFSVLVIFVVRIFPTAIQADWVASGQVTSICYSYDFT
jgi:hypothetical protein